MPRKSTKLGKERARAKAVSNRKLTEREKKKVIHALSVGGSYADAARYAGVRSVRLRKAIDEDPAFWEQMEQIQAGCKIEHLETIHGGDKEWRASAWMLARKWHKEFAQKPAESFDRDQVYRLLTGLSKMVVEQIKDSADRKRVTAKLQDFILQLDKMSGNKTKVKDSDV